MRLLAAQTGGAGEITRLLKGRPDGSSIFAGGLLVLLLLIVGVPVAMVVLMSLRTGFPGEGGPLTLVNFIRVYTDPATYEILLNTVLFATGAVAVTVLLDRKSTRLNSSHGYIS